MRSTDLDRALKVLCGGGVIAHATETCYGFACDARNEQAVQRLYALKKMSRSKPISLLVSDCAMARQYAIFDKSALALAKKYWPGPLTLVLKRKKALPAWINPNEATVGLRVSGHRLSRALCQALGGPLTTTSANISGLSPPYSVSAIRRQFRGQRNKPDFFLDSGRLKKNPPSTVARVTQEKIEIIRPGPIKL